MTKKAHWFWLIVGITLLGAVLRSFRLGWQSLWLDELFSVLLVRRNWVGIVAGTAEDILPPLFYLLLNLALRLGESETAARLVPFFFSVLTIPLAYRLTQELFNRQAALAAAIFLAINPFHVLYAQEARMYTQFAFFSTAAAFFLWRAWHNNNRRDWIYFTLVSILNLYTHSLAFLTTLALILYVLIHWRQGNGRWRSWFISHAIIGVAFLPWVAVILQQTTRLGSEFSGASQSPFTLFRAIYLFLFSTTTPIPLAGVGLVAALTLLAFAVLTKRKKAATNISLHTQTTRQATTHVSVPPVKKSPVLFAVLIFAVPVIGLYLISLIQPIFIERRLLPASIGLYVLLGWADVRPEPRWLNRILGVALGVSMLSALPNYYTNPDVQKIPMRTVAQAVADQIEQGDVVIHTSDTSALAFMIYQPHIDSYFLSGDPDYVLQSNRGRAQRIAGLEPATSREATENHERIWLIVTLDHAVDYQQERLAEFDNHYMRLDQKNVGGVDIYLFEGDSR